MTLCQVKDAASHAVSGMRLRMKHEKTVCLAFQRKKSDDPAEEHHDMDFRDNAKTRFAALGEPGSFGCTKDNPRLCRGNKRALAENKEIKRIPQ